MTLKKIYITIAALALAGLAAWSWMATAYNYKEDAEEATGLVLSVYLEEGMAGLIALSKECYEHEKTKAQTCLASDVASKVWDRGVTAAMKLPTEDYFDDERIIERLLESDKGKMFTKAEAAAIIPKIAEVVDERLVVEWQRQKYKLDTAD